MISFLDQQESVFAAIVEPIFHVVRAAVVPAIHALGYRKPPDCLLLALWRPAGTATPRLRHLLLAVRWSGYTIGQCAEERHDCLLPSVGSSRERRAILKSAGHRPGALHHQQSAQCTVTGD